MILAAKAAIATSTVSGAPYQWVMIGFDNSTNTSLIMTSTTTDGSSWTSRTSPFGNSSSTWGVSVATDGNNNYVAVGNGGLLATSTGGVTWTLRTSSFGTDDIKGIGYGNDGYWVAVGDNGKLATSTDMVTWNQRVSGTTNNLVSAKWGNGLWIIGGASGFLATSSDPTAGTFTSRSSTLSNYVYTYYWPTVGIWVAGSDSGTTGSMASSTNGTTWTSRNSASTLNSAQPPDNLTSGPLGLAASTTVIVLGQGQGGATPNDCNSSVTGTGWTNRSLPGDGWTRHDVDEDNHWLSCTALPYSLLGGYEGVMHKSSNGTTWTTALTNRQVIGGSGTIRFWDICHSAGVASIR